MSVPERTYDLDFAIVRIATKHAREFIAQGRTVEATVELLVMARGSSGANLSKPVWSGMRSNDFLGGFGTARLELAQRAC